MKIIGITALIAVGIGCLYLLADADSVSAENQFDVFIQTYKVGYSDEYEYDYRLKVFRANLDKIDEMNRRNPQATFGITKFADRTQEEMDLQRILHENDKKQCGHRTYSGTPQDSNWVGKIPQVINQGQCGSSWALGVVASAEGRYSIFTNSTGPAEQFSVQQLIDCDDQSYGCSGGFPISGFEVFLNNDICRASEYNYTGTSGDCKTCQTGIRLSECYSLNNSTEEILVDLTYGPISIAADALTWQFYQSGIVTDCNFKSLNHGVALVGYNSSESSVNIRNSWGANWGEAGHIRVGANGTCGWHLSASAGSFY
ncbi:unnamed protein product [Moneuplotes crassus]|uniref:Uncharacterized protein n=1 Tax=Euplotes crassus TaxID=5936 RepID=A0AAD1XM04_EUPCR|nr:unnamed protein product [Moneuplotes crassus]